jgi:ankyrin repeat protein
VNQNEGKPLIITAKENHIKALSCLIANKADVHMQNDKALQLAIVKKHKHAVRILLEAGANPLALFRKTVTIIEQTTDKEILAMLLAYAKNVPIELASQIANHTQHIDPIATTQWLSEQLG